MERLEISPWFDRLADFAQEHKGHRCFGEMRKAIAKHPTRKAVEGLRKAVAGMPRGGGVRSEVLRTVDAVLSRGFRSYFRFSFSTYPKWSGQCSAASELFSSIRQAVTYHD